MTSPNAVQEAVELTLRTIERRARLYRNLVVFASVVLVGSPIVSILGRSLRPLVFLGGLLPATAIHLIVDARVLRSWTRQISNLHKTKSLSISVLSNYLLTNPLVPSETIKGMLLMLDGRRASLNLPPGEGPSL